MNPIQHAIESRVSTNDYDAERALSDDTIANLISLATRAPSAYNLQNWCFIAVRSAEAKARLKEVAYGQQKVMDAAVSVIVCGTLDGHRQLARMLQPAVAADILSQRTADSWVAQAGRSYADQPVLQRDEAIRSASLAAMTLMLAAEGMGLSSCPMTGFDSAALSREFGLTAQQIPALIVTIGYRANDEARQKPRKPLSEVLQLV
ncbi:nitroreductase family protein [Chitinimonas lacunae]|uniref:Nitroreductase family protein n=1 Tax=Chitinimonas lacunae TaxID=1963018 RepID=A0ABV8MNX6_9NEIS